MSGPPREILIAILGAIDDLVMGRSDIAETQQQLSANSSALDRATPPELVRMLRDVDADLEEIQFTMLEHEQPPAAIFRLDELRQFVLARLLGTQGSDPPVENESCST